MSKHKKMSEIIIQIDGKEVKAAEGKTVLEAAQSADIFIPTLCFHEKLEPYGACRICTVEVEARGRTNLVAACLYPVEQDLIVRSRSEVKKKNAVGFVDRGIRKEISFIPEIASKECNSCKECFPLCPTSYLQAAFVLAQAFYAR